jgi:hypothetical protein
VLLVPTAPDPRAPPASAAGAPGRMPAGGPPPELRRPSPVCPCVSSARFPPESRAASWLPPAPGRRTPAAYRSPAIVGCRPRWAQLAAITVNSRAVQHRVATTLHTYASGEPAPGARVSVAKCAGRPRDCQNVASRGSSEVSGLERLIRAAGVRKRREAEQRHCEAQPTRFPKRAPRS